MGKFCSKEAAGCGSELLCRLMVLDATEAWHAQVVIWSTHGIPRIDDKVMAAMVIWLFGIEMQPGSNICTWLDQIH